MFELELLIAMGLGAALVAIAPAVKAVGGGENRVSRSIGDTGRAITKQGLKLGIRLADSTGGLLRGISQGFSEVGESFTDLLAEAKADLEQSKAKRTTSISSSRS